MLPRTRWSIYVSIELSLSSNVNRAFKGKLRKPCLRYPVL
jgi:hypothetical protein